MRELDAPAGAGLNQVVWDLRLTEEDAAGNTMDPGPRVLPGVYIAELTTGSDVVQQELQVRMDPRVEMSRRELMVRHQSMMESYRLSGPVESAEDALDAMREQLVDVEDLLADREGVETLRDDVAAMKDTLDTLEEELDDASDGAGVWGGIQGVSAPPTADALWQIERSWERVPGVIERINGVIEGAMPALLGRVYTDQVVPRVDAVPMPDRTG